MRRYLPIAMAALAFAWSIALTAVSARADSPITITVQPVYTLNTTSDAQKVLPGTCSQLANPASLATLAATCNNAPPVTNTLQLNYGISYRIDAKSSLSYMHDNSDFSLGALVTAIPGVSLLTGDIRDRIDTVSYNYGFGHGLNGSVYYQSHQRMYVAGLCLNQENCPTTGGGTVSNPSSINETVYGVGFKYTFLHLKQLPIPLLTINADAQYVPRPAFNAAGAGTGGYPAGVYVSSGWQYPYGATLNVPILPGSWGALPFASYQRVSVWWKAENTPEAFNAFIFGVAKPLSKYLTLALTQTHFNGCLCSDTVPPPDNINFSMFQATLTYTLKP
jgi:hypothetical protein